MNRLDPAVYTIAWIAPLEIEAQAALHMLDHRHRGRFPVSRGDDYVFQAGDINGHNIIIATLPESQEYGTGSAAALASQVKKFFPNLWFGLLVGIAAGLPNLDKDPPLDIRLGDVLVGLPEGESAGLIAYELGKETATGFQPLRLGRVLANTETVVRSAIGSIKMMAPNDVDEFLPLYETIKDKQHPRGTFQDPGQEKDILYRTDSDGLFHVVIRGERSANNRTRVWYGPIGSGDKLVKNAERHNELRDRYNIIGLEMEAAGTMNRIPVGVIRGVCDYGDEHKNKDWQPYAAAMAAAYAKAVLHHLGPGDAVPQQSDICEVPPNPLNGAILGELPPKTDRFFGRERVVLCGISGSGKTQLAHEYVTQRRLQFSAILWIDAGSETSIEQSFASCFEGICEQVTGVRAQEQKTPPRAFVLDSLRNTLNKNWLVVIDRANDPIPNRTLLEPSMKLSHGSICVTSTHKAIAHLLKRAQILVERLDRVSAQSLLLWRASTGNDELAQEDDDAAWQAAKVLDGFPIGLELAGILIHEGIVPLRSFAQSFTHNYKSIARFQVDPGMWMWDTSDSLFSMFDALYKSLVAKNPQTGHLLSICSVYGPWSIPISLLHGLELHNCQDSVGEIDPSSQLQLLVDNDVELKLAIYELERLFLVKKMSDAKGNVVSISLHASLCQWRLAAMGEEGPAWIMQASYGLAHYIESQSIRKG
ncbi:BH4-2 domain-containing protein [Fusarium sp. LHS14.1]|nr:BH4-2 domain-containing protein [Fusarium sp. LHS14.1]